MGEYRNGKWTPTFGDEQFGVVDSPGQMIAWSRLMYNRVRELEAEIERLTHNLRIAKANYAGAEADIERLRSALYEIAERDPLESISASIAKAALEGDDG